MRAKRDGECDGCGNPGITANVTRVELVHGRVVRCEVCTPELANEPDEEDPNALYTLCVRILGQRFAKPDGSFYIYIVAVTEAAQLASLPDGAKKPFSLKGPIGQFTKDDVILVTGRFNVDRRYGFQLDAASAGQLAVKESEAALLAFLSQFAQIGRVRSRQILTQFGGMNEVLRILDDEPMRLLEIPGLTEERVMTIKSEYDRCAGFREFRLFAAGIGMTESLIASAIEAWGSEAEFVIRANAFSLLELPRVSFKTADEVHRRLGGDPKSPTRCAAGTLLVLNTICGEGHTYALHSELNPSSPNKAGEELRKLQFSVEDVEVGLELLANDRQVIRKGAIEFRPPHIVREDDRIFLRDVYQAEASIARELARLQSGVPRFVESPKTVADDLAPSAEQLDAIKLACEHPVVIVTGGPGCGKTQAMRMLLNVLHAAGESIACCAPTGKAAKRMSELTGRPASTIHRLIGFFDTSSDTLTLDESVVCVDECSMVDVLLMSKLMSSLRTGARLILVGDVNQLPSIGPGRMFHDLIQSERIPVVRLTRIFRQESSTVQRIPEVARDILAGVLPDLQVKGTDVTFLPFLDPEMLAQKIVKAVVEQLPAKLDVDQAQIQVISPQNGEEGKKNWPIGVRALNIALQEALNPNVTGGAELHIGEGYIARTQDRVIHTKNNYDLCTMNGEQGTIIRADAKPFVPPSEVFTSSRVRSARDASMPLKAYEKPTVLLVVDFGDRQVGYTKDECRELQLAYALTCHRCQGSEYPVVVLPIHDVHQFMLTQPLVYTALTRAKRYVLILGQETRMQKAVKNRRGVERRTALQERLLVREIQTGTENNEEMTCQPQPQPQP